MHACATSIRSSRGIDRVPIVTMALPLRGLLKQKPSKPVLTVTGALAIPNDIWSTNRNRSRSRGARLHVHSTSMISSDHDQR